MTELDAGRIATAALAVADEHGADGFTMRSVANALGVTPMALYHHVEDKAALAQLVVDLVIGERPLPAAAGTSWQDELWAMAQWMRETMQAHPVVVHLRRQYKVWTPSIFAMAERWLTIWQQSGLELDKAVVAATTSSRALIGAVEEEMVMQNIKVPDGLVPARYPQLRTLLAAKRDREAEYELLVRSLVEGIHARLMHDPDAGSTVIEAAPPHAR